MAATSTRRTCSPAALTSSPHLPPAGMAEGLQTEAGSTEGRRDAERLPCPHQWLANGLEHSGKSSARGRAACLFVGIEHSKKTDGPVLRRPEYQVSWPVENTTGDFVGGENNAGGLLRERLKDFVDHSDA